MAVLLDCKFNIIYDNFKIFLYVIKHKFITI